MNIVQFFRFVTGYEPYKYQIRFLQDEAKKIAVRAGRKVGKTEEIAVKALYTALYKPRQEILLVAPVMRQSKEILFARIEWMVSNKPEILKEVKHKSRGMDVAFIIFKNGSRIMAIPAGSTSDRIRGFTPTMIIVDEAGFVPEPAWTVLEESLLGTKDAVIILSSTPKRNVGRYYDAFKKGSGFSTYHIPCRLCPRITEKEIEDAKKRRTFVDYQREICGEFAEIGTNYFPLKLVDDCAKGTDIDTPEKGKVYRLAVDIARFGEDETVYMIGRIYGNHIEVVKAFATQKKPSTHIIEKVKVLHEFWNFDQINLDTSGIGAAIYDFLLKENLPVVECPYHTVVKSEYYKGLKVLMEHDHVKYPKKYDKLITQLKELEFDYAAVARSAIIKISAPKYKHDDWADALALLCKGISLVELKEEDVPFFMVVE